MTGKKILVADDDPAIRMLLDHGLTSDGISVTTVPNEKEAIAELNNINYDAVLTDLCMPVNDAGIKVLEECRRLGQPSVRYIASGTWSNESRENAEAVGATKIIAKPYHLSELTEMLKRDLGYQ